MYLFDTEVEILVGGKPVKKFSHEGRTYIQANKGSAYSIKIRNNSWKRRMFNVSVDGINVVNGEAAGKSPFGYVLNGYSTYEIQGFRTSNEEVHPFKFNDKQKSYAAKSDETGGDISNCGVIGVQVYDEKEKPAPIAINHYHTKVTRSPVEARPWWAEPTYGSPTFTCNESPFSFNAVVRGTSAGNAGSIGEALRSCNFMSQVETPKEEWAGTTTCSDWSAGTEFSKDSVVDKVTNTNFEIGNLLVTVEIFYDYRDGLIAKGVPVFREVKVAAPSAFPTKFCKPPKD